VTTVLYLSSLINWKSLGYVMCIVALFSLICSALLGEMHAESACPESEIYIERMLRTFQTTNKSTSDKRVILARVVVACNDSNSVQPYNTSMRLCMHCHAVSFIYYCKNSHTPTYVRRSTYTHRDGPPDIIVKGRQACRRRLSSNRQRTI
jgi:hypothetical protein